MSLSHGLLTSILPSDGHSNVCVRVVGKGKDTGALLLRELARERSELALLFELEKEIALDG